MHVFGILIRLVQRFGKVVTHDVQPLEQRQLRRFHEGHRRFQAFDPRAVGHERTHQADTGNLAPLWHMAEPLTTLPPPQPWARASAAPTTALAPSARRTRAASWAVAPVVITSSTNKTERPRTATVIRTRNAPRTFSLRALRPSAF